MFKLMHCVYYVAICVYVVDRVLSRLFLAVVGGVRLLDLTTDVDGILSTRGYLT